MNRIRFVQIYKDDNELYQKLLPVWCDYMKEVNGEGEDTPLETVTKDLQRRVNNQGSRNDMHLELFFVDDVFIGFAHFAIVKGPQYDGLLEPGNGFVLEFYIIPEHRRKGYGRVLYNHIEKILKNDGAEHICLTANHATGEPFWMAMGYTGTEKIDTDNDLPVYVKKIQH